MYFPIDESEKKKDWMKISVYLLTYFLCSETLPCTQYISLSMYQRKRDWLNISVYFFTNFSFSFCISSLHSQYFLNDTEAQRGSEKETKEGKSVKI